MGLSIVISTPSSARQGDTVSVGVTLTNTGASAELFKAEIYAVPEGSPDVLLTTKYKNISPGESYNAYVQFIMPSSKTIVFVWAERFDNDDFDWGYIASASKTVLLEAASPSWAGTIYKKELEYEENRALIPASNIPIGDRGLVHIWGRNDMATDQKLGVHWIVRDPSGRTVEDYEDWEFGKTGPGKTHEFIGGRFDIDQLGTWTISIGLSMNPDAPLNVDTYSGKLLSVVSVLGEAAFKSLSASYSRI